MITGLVCERIPRAYGLDAMRDVQVLSPMHKGEAGTQSPQRGPARAAQSVTGPEVARGLVRFRLGDRVLQTKNDYEKDVFNGDLGHIEDVDVDGGRGARVL